MRSHLYSTALLALVVAPGVKAQGVEDNVVATAGDAFGQSVGNERIGIYSTDEVRGFSPVDAGNARIEGLFFSPIERPPNRLVLGSRVRVGLTAQGYATSFAWPSSSMSARRPWRGLASTMPDRASR